MFLGILETEDKKDFFLGLAAVVAIAEGDISSIESDVKGKGYNLDGFIKDVVKACFSDREISTIKNYACEMGRYDLARAGDDELLELITFNGGASPSASSGVVGPGMIGINALLGARGGFSLNRKRSIIDIIDSIFNEVSDEKNFDKEVKKKITNELIDDGVDVSSISKEEFKARAFFIKDVRENILIGLVDFFCSSGLVSELSPVEKKAIIFELIGMGYAENGFEEFERLVVDLVCEKLQVDAETLEELELAASKAYGAYMEAFELVME